MKKKTIKWILGIVGLIFLGVLSNALWDQIEPAWKWFLNIAFKITTLGLASRSDDFYQRVAKGLHEESSLQVLFLVTLIIVYYVAGEIGKILGERGRKRVDKKLQEIKDRIEQYEKSTNNDAQILKQKAIDEHNEYIDKLLRSSRRSTRIWISWLIIFSSFILLRQTTIINRNNAVTHFRRVFTAAKYAMNDEEEELILLEFSAIKNQQDYSNVLKKLQEKLAEKGQELEKEQQRLEIERQKAEKELEDLTSSSVKDKTK